MKIHITTLLLTLPLFAWSQFKSSLDFTIGGHSTHRNLSSDSDLDFIVDIRKDEESALNWSTGIHYNRLLSERWYLKTGVQMTRMDYKSRKVTEFTWGSQTDTDFVFDPTIPTGELQELTSIQNIYQRRFVGIPIALRRVFKSGRITPFIEAAVTPSFLLSAKRKFVTNISTRKFDDSYPSQHDFHLVGYISAGVQYTPASGFQWFAQPIFRYHFTATVDAPIKEHLYGVGLELGVRKQIR